MLPKSWRRVAAGAGLLAVLSFAGPASADDIDHPTMRREKLAGASQVTGTITPAVAFPAHEYTASRDGFVRIQIETTNVRRSDNDGVAWRPYLRVLSVENAQRNGEAWSTNGHQSRPDPLVAKGELVFRVRAGEKFTVIATLALHFAGRSRGNATYKIVVTEVSP